MSIFSSWWFKQNSNSDSSSVNTSDVSELANNSPLLNRPRFQRFSSESDTEETIGSTCYSSSHQDDGLETDSMPQSSEESMAPKPDKNFLCDGSSVDVETCDCQCRQKDEYRKIKARNELQNMLLVENERIMVIHLMIENRWNLGRLEDEKQLLMSFVKKDLILEQLLNLANSSMELDDDPVRVSYVSISNIEFYNTLPPTHRYYLCLVTHDTTVLGSKIVDGTTAKDINFKEHFGFTSLRRDFKIHLKLYELTLPMIHKQLFSRRPDSTKIPEDVVANQFELVGETTITMRDIHIGYISAVFDVNPTKKAIISAKVTGTLNLLPEAFSAFVDFAATTTSDGRISWTNKWSVLDGTELNICNSPQEEDLIQTLRIDLSKITFRQAKREECDRSTRTVVITPPSSNGLKYFICVANEKDLESLLKNINLAICTKTNETMRDRYDSTDC